MLAVHLYSLEMGKEGVALLWRLQQLVVATLILV
jgi:hypothetical protein